MSRRLDRELDAILAGEDAAPDPLTDVARHLASGVDALPPSPGRERIRREVLDTPVPAGPARPVVVRRALLAAATVAALLIPLTFVLFRDTGPSPELERARQAVAAAAADLTRAEEAEAAGRPDETRDALEAYERTADDARLAIAELSQVDADRLGAELDALDGRADDLRERLEPPAGSPAPGTPPPTPEPTAAPGAAPTARPATPTAPPAETESPEPDETPETPEPDETPEVDDDGGGGPGPG